MNHGKRDGILNDQPKNQDRGRNYKNCFGSIVHAYFTFDHTCQLLTALLRSLADRSIKVVECRATGGIFGEHSFNVDVGMRSFLN